MIFVVHKRLLFYIFTLKNIILSEVLTLIDSKNERKIN
jgi:hypothetical protein